MDSPARHIVVLGAPGTGASELAQQLRQALATHPEYRVHDALAPGLEHGFALLMGLDLSSADPAHRALRMEADAALRQQLQRLGLPFRVVYGGEAARLDHALLALGLPSPDRDTQQAREAAQFELNRGRTPWSCEKCSDPACEHRLFTGLLRGTSPAPAAD